jgi:hypothetical protein
MMDLRTKIKIANGVCISSFIVMVAMVFIYPFACNIFLCAALVSGTWAAKWKKQLVFQNGDNSNEAPWVPNKSLGRPLTWLCLIFYVPLTVNLFWLGISRLHEGNSVDVRARAIGVLGLGIVFLLWGAWAFTFYFRKFK